MNTLWPSKFTSRYVSNRDSAIGPPTGIYKNVHRITICKSQNLETSQWKYHKNNGIQYSNENEQPLSIYKSMDKFHT